MVLVLSFFFGDETTCSSSIVLSIDVISYSEVLKRAQFLRRLGTFLIEEDSGIRRALAEVQHFDDEVSQRILHRRDSVAHRLDGLGQRGTDLIELQSALDRILYGQYVSLKSFCHSFVYYESVP